MVPFKHSQQNPSPDVEKSEIILNNGESDLTEGSFMTLLKPNVLSKKQPIVSSIVNPPLFQISVNLNPQNSPPRMVVLLGDAVSDPKDKETFEIPSDLDLTKSHEIKVEWKNTQISGVFINNKQVKLYSPGALES